MEEKELIARLILDTIPPAMAKIRGEMRASSPEGLSVPQFRILGSIFRGRTLIGELAQHQGVSQPAMSKMVESLVSKGLVRRTNPTPDDRRQTPLALTPKGSALFRKIRASAQLKLSARVSALTPEERRRLTDGLATLERLFA